MIKSVLQGNAECFKIVKINQCFKIMQLNQCYKIIKINPSVLHEKNEW